MRKRDTDSLPAAIQFEIQTCNAVNETAPDTVGCSTSGLSSVISFNTATLTSTGPSTMSTDTSISMDMSTATGVLVTTVSGNVTVESSILSGAPTITATWGTKALLTGSCTVPGFAAVTENSGIVTEFPEIGCAPGREDCCPFDSQDNGVLTECPEDYFTTSGACCPS